MPKKTRDIGQEILEGLRQIKRGEIGRVVNVPDVAATREKTGLSQTRFAELLGVSVRTLQDWEQGRRALGRRSNAANDCRQESQGLARSCLTAWRSRAISLRGYRS